MNPTSQQVLNKALNVPSDPTLAAASTPQPAASSPGFSDTMDAAIQNLKAASAKVNQQAQKNMQVSTKNMIKETLLATPQFKDLLSKQAALNHNIGDYSTSIQGSADVNPLAQRSANSAGLGSYLDAATRAGNDAMVRSQGVDTVLQSITDQQKQQAALAQQGFENQNTFIGALTNAQAAKQNNQLFPYKLQGEKLANEKTVQEISGSQPITSEQRITFLNQVAQAGGDVTAAGNYLDSLQSGKAAINLNNARSLLGAGVTAESQGFGVKDMINGKVIQDHHSGLDFAAAGGSPALAPRDMTIVSAGPHGGYGNAVIGKDADGKLILLGHLSATSVKPGDTITAGQEVGKVGSTGNSTGNHIHLEVRDTNGTPVNPMVEFPQLTNSFNDIYGAGNYGNKKQQNALEQQYRNALLKELSNRSGGLGLQDQKVNQAIHLRTLINQYKDKNGNYNIPTAQYAELVYGLANLISPTGETAESDRRNLMAKTSAGDLKGALQYITGTPQTGNTQAMIKNLVDSIERQGQVSQQLRDQYIGFLQGLVPTGLDPARTARLNQTTLNQFAPTGIQSVLSQPPQSAAAQIGDTSALNTWLSKNGL